MPPDGGIGGTAGAASIAGLRGATAGLRWRTVTAVRSTLARPAVAALQDGRSPWVASLGRTALLAPLDRRIITERANAEGIERATHRFIQ